MASVDVKKSVVDSFVQFEVGLHNSNNREQATHLEKTYAALIPRLPLLALCDDAMCTTADKEAKVYLQGVLNLHRMKTDIWKWESADTGQYLTLLGECMAYNPVNHLRLHAAVARYNQSTASAGPSVKQAGVGMMKTFHDAVTLLEASRKAGLTLTSELVLERQNRNNSEALATLEFDKMKNTLQGDKNHLLMSLKRTLEAKNELQTSLKKLQGAHTMLGLKAINVNNECITASKTIETLASNEGFQQSSVDMMKQSPLETYAHPVGGICHTVKRDNHYKDTIAKLSQLQELFVYMHARSPDSGRWPSQISEELKENIQKDYDLYDNADEAATVPDWNADSCYVHIDKAHPYEPKRHELSSSSS
jgi:hypothetical protein